MEEMERKIGQFIQGYGGEIDKTELYKNLGLLFAPKDAHISLMNLLNEGMIVSDGIVIRITERFKALL